MDRRGNHLDSSLRFAIVLWSLKKVLKNFFLSCDGICRSRVLN